MAIGRNQRLRKAASSLVLALALAGAGLAAAPAALAQDEDDDEIVVIGSRIRTDPLTNRQPVTELGSGRSRPHRPFGHGRLLQRLPVSGGGLTRATTIPATSATRPMAAASAPALRKSICASSARRRVLVLVDGHRWVNGTAGSGIPGSVDLNTIPSSMIERIEVLQESASPIYGSDAIAGVVNIITRRQQDGLDAYAQYGGYFEEGDGLTQDYDVCLRHQSHGSSDSIVIGANYQDQELVILGRPRALGLPVALRHQLRDRAAAASGIVNGCFDIIDPNVGPLGLARPVGSARRASRVRSDSIPPTPDGNNTFRAFADRGRPLQFRAVQLSADAIGALRRVCVVHARLDERDARSACASPTRTASRPTRPRRCRSSSARTPATARARRHGDRRQPTRSIRSASS